MKFQLQQTDGAARCGLLETEHGVIETPVFMPVGTRGTVKAVTMQQLEQLGPQIILGNTYHLMLRPGKEVLEAAGGLHRFNGWSRALLTDSGGYQVFSLSELNQVREEGVLFRSHLDGSSHFLGPRESIEIQRAIGSDIVMAFDQCSPYPCTHAQAQNDLERTQRWAQICRETPLQPHQALFGIVQGSVYSDLRLESVRGLLPLGFEGYAIGGLSVGEPAELMYQVLDQLMPELPAERPRYLMGVGTPRNLVEAVRRGVDMFDCVLPTRNGRNGQAFTWSGKVNLRAAIHMKDFSPIDPQLDHEASQSSRAYVRHLLQVGEMTGLTLVTLQNLAFYLDFMRQMRHAIKNCYFEQFYQKVCQIYPA
jgi:queuine tRNA-ribosyltransferase